MAFLQGGTGGTKMDETALIQKIKKHLAGLDGCFFWKEHGGQYSTAGIPDIICCYKGLFVAFESKVGKNKPTKLQAKTIAAIRKSGGIAEVVHSLDDVKRIISQL